MVHLNEEVFSELVDGGVVAGAEEHLASCAACRDQLASLRDLKARLRALPELEAPAHLWSAIEARLTGRPARDRRFGWPALIGMQAAAMAAVFVIGLGIGSMFTGDEALEPSGVPVIGQVAEQPPASSLEDALAEVRRRGAEYDVALRRLERMASRAGTPMASLAVERLAALDVLVEASRSALATRPADAVLNSYLFAALEQREEVLRELARQAQQEAEAAWR